MKGYAGKITYVDLTAGRVWDESVDESFARKYLGGSGFASRVLFDRVPGGAEPLGDENAFILCAGPVSGTLAHGSGRGGIVTKSPLTGYFMDSYFGGEFAASLKQSGRDMVVLLGKSPSPVFVFIDNDDVQIVPAESLWGLTTKDAQDRIREEYGKYISIVCCGPAGENLVPIACCISGRRAAGRGGTGAVLGSKNVKAVAVRGTKDVEVADIKGLIKFYRDKKAKFEGLKALRELGTPFLVKFVNEKGGLGTLNWQQETWEKAKNLYAEQFLQKHLLRSWACFACNMGGCTRVVRAVSKSSTVTEGPEYETLFALGSNCGVDDRDKIIETDRLCDDYGIDTISYGGCIGFLMECYEKGLITREDTGGIDFSFGNGDTLVACTHLVARREGFGDFIALGVKKMAEKIGKEAEKFACHIRGLEPPGHSARALKSMALGYAVSPRGGSHHDTRPGPEYQMEKEDRAKTEGKAQIAYNTSNWAVIGDSMIVCHFCEGVYGVTLTQNHVDLLRLVTGWDLSLDELTEIANRIHTLKRSFNCREGLRRKDDRLPYRFLHEKIPSGSSGGLGVTPEELQQLLDEYYQLRGWDSEGVPTRETLDKLGLEDVVISS